MLRCFDFRPPPPVSGPSATAPREGLYTVIATLRGKRSNGDDEMIKYEKQVMEIDLFQGGGGGKGGV